MNTSRTLESSAKKSEMITVSGVLSFFICGLGEMMGFFCRKASKKPPMFRAGIRIWRPRPHVCQCFLTHLSTTNDAKAGSSPSYNKRSPQDTHLNVASIVFLGLRPPSFGLGAFCPGRLAFGRLAFGARFRVRGLLATGDGPGMGRKRRSELAI